MSHGKVAKPEQPKLGLAGLKQNWRNEILSGFLVFLIALPLCLGISLASGFPPSSGIISAIVGGLLVSKISGSYVTINGPAAGLIVVVLGAVQSLGEGDALLGYRYTLAAIAVSSIFQIGFGLFKAGRLSSFFPASVIHGMLAAIGIIIITKQIHIMLGVTPQQGSLLATMAQIPHSLVNFNPEIALIGFLGLTILVIWSLLKNPSLKMIPAPLLVVILGMGLGRYFDLEHEHVYLFLPETEFLPHHEQTVGPKFLVTIPGNFIDSFCFPDFSKIVTPEFWGAVLSICLVGSLESLLSAMAVDKLDPYQRHTNLDRDLMAVGTGNLIASMIGGLPMIAEIVRSSANVNNGAKTGWANFFHGGFLLLFVILFPTLIHRIPLAALAALLVFTGYRLASPKEFAKVMGVGKEQLGLFVITIIGVLATDLLMGVAIGIIAKLILHIIRGVWLKNLFKIYFKIEQQDANTVVIKVLGSAIFSNFLALKKALVALPQGKTLVFDFTDAYLIDHTVMEALHDYMQHYQSQGGHCQQLGKPLEVFSDHALAARIMTPDDRKNKYQGT